MIKKTTAYFMAIILIYLGTMIAFYAIDNKIIMPHPNDIINRLGQILVIPQTYLIIFNTFLRLFIALLISCALGIILGILSAISKTVNYLIHPFIIFIKTTPLVALLCILLMVVGRLSSPVIITVLLIFPIIYEAVNKGIKEVIRDYQHTWILESRMNFVIIKRIIFPQVSTYFTIALFQGIGLGLKMMVMAEYFSQTKNSIGKKLYDALPLLEFADIFSWTIILIAIILVIEVILQILTPVKMTFEY